MTGKGLENHDFFSMFRTEQSLAKQNLTLSVLESGMITKVLMEMAYS